jgi:hypothetical protein
VGEWKSHIPRADPVTIAVRFCGSVGIAYLRTQLHGGAVIRDLTASLGEVFKYTLAGRRKAMMGTTIRTTMVR